MFLLHPSHMLCEEAKKKSCMASSSLRFPNSIGNLRESWYLGRNASGAPELWLCTVRLFTFPLRSNYGCSLETHESWPATEAGGSSLHRHYGYLGGGCWVAGCCLYIIGYRSFSANL